MRSRAGLTIDAPVRPGTGAERGRDSRIPVRVPTTRLFDLPLAAVTYDEIVGLVNRTLGASERPPGALTIDAVNTMGLSEGCLDPRMRAALLSYDLIVPDSTPVVWCMNAKGAGLPDRVYGPYLCDRLLAGLERPTRVAMIGGFAPLHDWLRRVAPFRWPNARFTLMYDAPPGEVDDAYVAGCAERIVASGAELVFVCLGVPRQYYWTALARTYLSGTVCVSVGGAFELVSGAKRIAPNWIQRAGLTWLYRMSQEPRRLGPRYLKYNTAFLWLLFRHEVLGRRRATHTAGMQ